MSGSKAAVLAALFLTAGLIHCSLGPNQCLRESDCESAFVCVEGTCEVNQSLGGDNGDSGVTEAGATTDTTASATDQ